MKKSGNIILIAGFGFFLLAFGVIGVVPWLQPKQTTHTIINFQGKPETVKKLSGLAAEGRLMYIHEGCWVCHSQFVRPVSGEKTYFGPVAQAGTYNYQLPMLLGKRRIGPDLSDEGGKHANDWQFAHLYDPNSVSPGSIMPSFSWLFHGSADKPTKRAVEIVAYIQTLGTDIAEGTGYTSYWQYEASKAGAAGAALGAVANNPQAVQAGRKIFSSLCVGCHGINGDGNGPAAAALNPRPWNFTTGEWIKKYGSADNDIYKRIAMGVPKTAMPAWSTTLKPEQIWDVLYYVKTFSKNRIK